MPQSREEKIRTDKSIEEESIKEEEKKNITTNYSYVHTSIASQKEPTNSISDSENDLPMHTALKNCIRLYFMKKYQTVDTFGFIDYYEGRNWLSEDGKPIIEDHKKHIDDWMEKIKGAPEGTPLET